MAGESGSPDTWRDVRGFSLKFYTDEGNYDLVGNNTPVFFVRDPMKFPHFIRSQKRLPDSGLRDNHMQWDFWTNNPETAHQVTYLMGDRGLPRTWRQMNGYGSHTYMWINAQEKIKKRLKDTGARLVGNISLVDQHNNYASLVTILYWMMTGKKDRKWGIFPKPGVADEDIAGAVVFGETVKRHFQEGDWETLQPQLAAQKAVNIKYPLMFIERKAGRIFKIWSGIIHKKKNRKAWLVAFKYYLLIALCVAAPVILLVDGIFFKPFLGKRIKKQKAYYAGVELK